MVSITVSLENEVREDLDDFPWVNWSEVVREALMQREIFEDFIRTGKISEEDREFCEEMDWHPVDWLPLREDFVKELKDVANGKHSKSMSPEELKKWFEEL